MMKQFTASILCITLLFLYLTPYAGLVGTPNIQEVPESVPAGNLMFEHQVSESTSDIFSENLGQIDNSDVKFYGIDGSIAFTQNSVIIYSEQISESQEDVPDLELTREPKWKNVTGNAMVFSFVNSNNIEPAGFEPVSWRTNYLMGSDPEFWHTDVPNYRGVMYADIWDGIDLVYWLNEGAIKYDFILHPGADTHQIKIQVSGQESISVNQNGELSIGTGLGPESELLDSGLVAFYEDDETEKIPARFALSGTDTYTFMLGEIDHSRTVIIDPLIYSTYLGGSNSDYCNDVAAGDDGCAYLVGGTNSLDFLTTPGGYDKTYAGYSDDIFVTKMGLNGNSIVYSTFIGDEGQDCGNAIAVDSTGCAYITGYTNSGDFPTTPGAFDQTYNGDSYDSFVTKLSAMGDSLVYSTLLGSNRVEYGNGICVDKDGYAYVTGEAIAAPPPGPIEFKSTTTETTDTGFPTTYGAFRWGFGLTDIFVTKFSQSGKELEYSTLFGTDDYETSNSIAVDDNGYAHITGYTKSEKYPTTTNAVFRDYNGGLDAFVTKLTPTGRSLAYSTFLGGSSGEIGYDIAVGEWGHTYVTGYTQSTDFPTSASAYSKTLNGMRDAFVTILSKYGDSITSSTYIGGSENDKGVSIAIDSDGYALVTGSTSSDNFPVTERAMNPTYNGTGDAFVVKSSSGGSIIYSSYLGGSGADHGTGIGVSPTGFTYVVGDTASVDYECTPGALDTVFNGDTDVFVAKMDLESPHANAGPDQRVDEGVPVSFSGSKSTDNYGIVNYTWVFNDGVENITYYENFFIHTFYIPENYIVYLNVSDETGNWAIDSMNLLIVDITNPVAIAGPDQIINEDKNASFNGSGSTDNVGIVNYSWSFVHDRRNIILYGNQTVFEFTEPGIYTVLLTVKDAAGNKNSDELVVSVNDITKPVAYIGEDRRVFNNTRITLDGTASTDNVKIVNYTWEFNDGKENLILYGAMPVHLFDFTGSFTITLNVSDAAGHHDSDSMVLTVLETIKPSANAGPDLTTNEGQPTIFDGSASTDNVAVFEWLWSFNDGLNDVTIVGSKPTWVFPLAGTYEITLNTTDAAGNWDTDTMTVTVIDASPPVVRAGRNQILNIGEEVYLDSIGTSDNSGIANYTWTFTYNGTDIVLFNSSTTFIFWKSGTYTITLTATDSVGNFASSTVNITILPQIVNQQEIVTTDNSGWTMVIASVIIIALSTIILLFNRRRMRP